MLNGVRELRKLKVSARLSGKPELARKIEEIEGMVNGKERAVVLLCDIHPEFQRKTNLRLLELLGALEAEGTPQLRFFLQYLRMEAAS